MYILESENTVGPIFRLRPIIYTSYTPDPLFVLTVPNRGAQQYINICIVQDDFIQDTVQFSVFQKNKKDTG